MTNEMASDMQPEGLAEQPTNTHLEGCAAAHSDGLSPGKIGPSSAPSEETAFGADENSPGFVLPALVRMGFDSDLAEIALVSADDDPANGSLLERAIAWLMASSSLDNNSPQPRIVTCIFVCDLTFCLVFDFSTPFIVDSKVVNAKPSSPPPLTHRPSKGILKPSPPQPENSFVKTAASLFSRFNASVTLPVSTSGSWLEKTLDNATSAASSIASQLPFRFSQSPSDVVQFPKSPIDDPELDKRGSSSSSNFVISGSESSLPLSPSSSKDSISESLARSSSTKLVRFSFPDLQIDPNTHDEFNENILDIDIQTQTQTIDLQKISYNTRKLSEFQTIYTECCRKRTQVPSSFLLSQLAGVSPTELSFENVAVEDKNLEIIIDFLGMFLIGRESTQKISLKFIHSSLDDEALKKLANVLIVAESCSIFLYFHGNDKITQHGYKYFSIYLKKVFI
ncbi:hypothetical protein HK096_009481 [Nowakowskiella sp. JEL0078]|nr:hypothetical protein HK096_009481 [Nowakowskiella sp. JEL0078]